MPDRTDDYIVRLTPVTVDKKASEQSSTMVHYPLPRPRILVLDHDEDVRLAVCDRLAYMGFDAEGEDNGISGLTRLVQEHRDHPFSGVLLEIDMPLLGGMAVLQELKDRHPQVPVIVMADARYVQKLREAVNLWAHDYLVKPFDTELLRRKCHAVFGAGSSKVSSVGGAG